LSRGGAAAFTPPFFHALWLVFREPENTDLKFPVSARTLVKVQ